MLCCYFILAIPFSCLNWNFAYSGIDCDSCQHSCIDYANTANEWRQYRWISLSTQYHWRIQDLYGVYIRPHWPFKKHLYIERCLKFWQCDQTFDSFCALIPSNGVNVVRCLQHSTLLNQFPRIHNAIPSTNSINRYPSIPFLWPIPSTLYSQP